MYNWEKVNNKKKATKGKKKIQKEITNSIVTSFW